MAQSSTLDRGAAQRIVEGLSEILADTFTLNLLTKNFHWNVIDPRFMMLHKFFDEQYEELNEAVDIIAERIRMLRGRTPASMQEYLNLTSVDENNTELTGDEMIRQLLREHEKVIGKLRFLIEEAEKFGDEGTADMYIQRLREHEKASWMLRAHLVDLA
jgi:starvation-inducible DNA-binding protein